MVSGYFSGSTSRSARAAGVTQPAQIFTRGNTAASSTSGRRPASASRQAAVLPPGPPPTTMASNGPLNPTLSPQGRGNFDPRTLSLEGRGSSDPSPPEGERAG